MPYILSKRGDQTCVLNQQTREVVPGGCHSSRADALRHMRALYVNVPDARRASMDEPEVSIELMGFSEEEQENAVFTLPQVVASAAPVAPPREWFFRPEPDVPTPMTYEDGGPVYGHLALNDSCHRGFMGGAYTECVKPPTSRTDYAQFHLGHIVTAEGESIPIGKITFDAPHAPMTADVAAASRHYDHTGSVGAYVRATNGRRGIWLSGALRPDLSPEDLVTLRANPLSGDWRSLNRNLELVATLAVPVPGFPITRSQLALSASVDGGMEVTTLILADAVDDLEEEEVMEASIRSEDELRKFKMAKKRRELIASGITETKVVEVLDKPESTLTLADRRMMKMLQNEVDELQAAVLTTRARKALSRSDFALSGRRYPIHDMAHARNALARSAGKPEEAAVRRAVCRKYPDMGECSS